MGSPMTRSPKVAVGLAPVQPALAVPGPSSRTDEAKSLMAALVATGTSEWEAMGVAAAAFGEDALRPLWKKWAMPIADSHTVIKALDTVAANAPGIANLWLNIWLDGRTVPSLDASNLAWVETLTSPFTVTGCLILSHTGITTLPEGLIVGEDLDLTKTPITALPEGITVGRRLRLTHTAITALPKTMVEVKGLLGLTGSKITSLPAGLKVDGTLYLDETPIRALPRGLKVGDTLSLKDTFITELPRNLRVDGFLDLANTPIQTLPRGLRIRSGLRLTGCTAWDGKIPDDTRANMIFTDRWPNGVSLANWRFLTAQESETA